MYVVSEYKKGAEDGLVVHECESFKEAKETANKARSGYEREVHTEIEDRRIIVYRFTPIKE